MTVKSGHGYLTRDWGDGTYTFRLAWGAWKELHEKCGCGPAELWQRLLNRTWLANDLSEIIRLGLIGGGGVTPVEALKKVADYVQERPLFESVPVALEIVSASLLGPADETTSIKKKRRAKREASPSQLSTATAQ